MWPAFLCLHLQTLAKWWKTESASHSAYAKREHIVGHWKWKVESTLDKFVLAQPFWKELISIEKEGNSVGVCCVCLNSKSRHESRHCPIKSFWLFLTGAKRMWPAFLCLHLQTLAKWWKTESASHSAYAKRENIVGHWKWKVKRTLDKIVLVQPLWKELISIKKEGNSVGVCCVCLNSKFRHESTHYCPIKSLWLFLTGAKSMWPAFLCLHLQTLAKWWKTESASHSAYAKRENIVGHWKWKVKRTLDKIVLVQPLWKELISIKKEGNSVGICCVCLNSVHTTVPSNPYGYFWQVQKACDRLSCVCTFKHWQNGGRPKAQVTPHMPSEKILWDIESERLNRLWTNLCWPSPSEKNW